jgi:hypothetical protein
MNILKLTDLYKVKAAVTVYRIINEGYAGFLYEDIAESIRTHNYNTRCCTDLLLPYPTVKAVKLNFVYRAIEIWNNLSDELKQSTSHHVLKSKYNKYLIQNY